MIKTNHNAVVPFGFQRPSSWDTEFTHTFEDRCVLQLTNRYERIEVGRIVIEARKRPASSRLDQFAREYAQHLKTGGFHLGGAPVVPVVPPAGFQAAAIFAPAARYDGHEFDAPVLLLQHPQALVALSLLGPSRQESPEWWAINKRAFEIVRDSLVIGSRDTAADMATVSGRRRKRNRKVAGTYRNL